MQRRRGIKFTLVTLLVTIGGLIALFPAAPTAFAVHNRATEFSWTQTTGNTVQFESVFGARRSFYGDDVEVGHVLSGVRVYFEEGLEPVKYDHTVIFVDVANDWILAEATFSYTYPGPGPYLTVIDDCCRIATEDHINNPDAYWRAETIVDLNATTASPRTAISPVVDCPKNSVCSFTIPAYDPDGQDIRYRMATESEARGTHSTELFEEPPFYQPGENDPSEPASIDPETGVYTWDTTGATLAPAGMNTLYSTQVIVENLVGDTVVTKTPVDFFIRLPDQGSTNRAPVFNDPTPADGTVYTVTRGSTITFDVAANDPDTNDTVSLTMLNEPADGEFTTSSGNPASGTFSWTPMSVGTTLLTINANDQTGLGATQRSVTIRVVDATSTPTATATATPTATATATATPTATATITPATVTPTATATATVTPAPITPTATATATVTPAPSTPTATATATVTPAPITPTATATATVTPAPITPTATATATVTPAPITPTATATATPTGTVVTGKTVRPILECVAKNNDGSYTAYFGYLNENTAAVTIAIGSNNRFSPTPEDRGQPTTFEPGRTPYWPDAAFGVNFNGQTLVWSLDGRTATASSSSIPCSNHVFIEKQWQAADGTALDGPPANLPADYKITASSDLGTATCIYASGETVLSCTYSNSQPALDNKGLWVPLGTNYTVTETGLPDGWSVVSGTGTFESGDDVCVAGRSGLAKYCTQTVKNRVTQSTTATNTSLAPVPELKGQSMRPR